MADYLVTTPGLRGLSVAIYADEPPLWWPHRDRLHRPGSCRMRELKPGERDLDIQQLRRIAEAEYGGKR